MTARKRKRLWWQTPDTAAWFFWLGGLWVLIAASQWWRLVGDSDPAAWRIILPVLSTGIAVAQLVAAVRRRRRERAGSVNQLQADHAAHDHQQEGDLQR